MQLAPEWLAEMHGLRHGQNATIIPPASLDELIKAAVVYLAENRPPSGVDEALVFLEANHVSALELPWREQWGLVKVTGNWVRMEAFPGVADPGNHARTAVHSIDFPPPEIEFTYLNLEPTPRQMWHPQCNQPKPGHPRYFYGLEWSAPAPVPAPPSAAEDKFGAWMCELPKTPTTEWNHNLAVAISTRAAIGGGRLPAPVADAKELVKQTWAWFGDGMREHPFCKPVVTKILRTYAEWLDVAWARRHDAVVAAIKKTPAFEPLLACTVPAHLLAVLQAP
jgi:hypothetical protein